MRSITKAHIFRDGTWAPPIMVLDHRSAPIRKLRALVIVYLTMIIAHFPDDHMCRRNNGGIWQRLCDNITTAAALPSSFMI
eukprot:scaffold4109_cov101-Skeletonema_dohrnii-CCMP3373.AAC.4